MSLTPTAAARWTTTSTSSMSSTIRGWSRIVPRASSNRGSPSRCATLRSEPVERSSIASMSSPRPIRCSARWDPMNPAPPVMRYRIVALARRRARFIVVAVGGG
jgi:hypothetical protein